MLAAKRRRPTRRHDPAADGHLGSHRCAAAGRSATFPPTCAPTRCVGHGPSWGDGHAATRRRRAPSNAGHHQALPGHCAMPSRNLSGCSSAASSNRPTGRAGDSRHQGRDCRESGDVAAVRRGGQPSQIERPRAAGERHHGLGSFPPGQKPSCPLAEGGPQREAAVHRSCWQKAALTSTCAPHWRQGGGPPGRPVWPDERALRAGASQAGAGPNARVAVAARWAGGHTYPLMNVDTSS